MCGKGPLGAIITGSYTDRNTPRPIGGQDLFHIAADLFQGGVGDAEEPGIFSPAAGLLAGYAAGPFAGLTGRTGAPGKKAIGDTSRKETPPPGKGPGDDTLLAALKGGLIKKRPITAGAAKNPRRGKIDRRRSH
jgi:hypothetical protein